MGVPLMNKVIPHPAMTDVLAVEEHLRWRMKELGAIDPGIGQRYGPSTNDPAALEDLNLPENCCEDGDDILKVSEKLVKVKGGRKMKKVVNGKKNSDKEKAVCYLPKLWAEGDPSERNIALILTFRHFVKVDL